jgi:LysR family transcriptional regulator, benzoate and cis,cis-muconate-responsive activator of ben and cat genes
MREMSGLIFEPLRQYAVCVAAHPSHPLMKLRKVGLKHIAGERLIAYTASDYPEYHAWIIRLFEPTHQAPNIAEEHDSSTSLIAAVEAGRGIALVQQGFECLTGPRLKVRALMPAPPPFVVGIAHQKDIRSKATEDFINAVRQTGPVTPARSPPSAKP